MGKSGFIRLARKLFPSLSRLTHNPAFKLAVDGADLPFRAMFREFRGLPPNHLRIRVGVGNRLLTNQALHYAGSPSFWIGTAVDGLWSWDSTILDIGCGVGRYAQSLRDLDYTGLRFNGRYIGVDIDEEMLAWCRAHFDSGRFTFIRSSDSSKSYNIESGTTEPFRIDLPDESVDFVFSTSLFTHLLEREMENYIRESHRLLRPGRCMDMSVFCLDYPPPTYGTRHTFAHRMGNAHVESLRQPEAAVAYTEEFLLRISREAGFSEARILHAPHKWQPVLRCRK